MLLLLHYTRKVTSFVFLISQSLLTWVVTQLRTTLEKKKITQFTWRTMSSMWSLSRENPFSDLFFCSWDLFLFYWPEWRCMELKCACVCVFSLLLMGPVCTHTHTHTHTHTPLPPFLLPMIPARLSGRALDRLSDEMMTLLWEAIPKWEVSDKDCTLLSLPRRPAAPRCQRRRWWLIRSRWIAGSVHWFSSALSKIFIYSCIHRAYPDSPHRPLFF